MLIISGTFDLQSAAICLYFTMFSRCSGTILSGLLRSHRRLFIVHRSFLFPSQPYVLSVTTGSTQRRSIVCYQPNKSGHQSGAGCRYHVHNCSVCESRWIDSSPSHVNPQHPNTAPRKQLRKLPSAFCASRI